MSLLSFIKQYPHSAPDYPKFGDLWSSSKLTYEKENERTGFVHIFNYEQLNRLPPGFASSLPLYLQPGLPFYSSLGVQLS